MTLDYGVVDEGPSRIGTLALLSAALKADLQRSINVRDSQSPPPLVSVDVGTISTTVMIEGRSRAVLAAWDRLGGLLAAPGLTVPAEPAPTPRPVWPQDLAAYTGANALTLGDLRIRGPRNLDVADALLARVAPAACRVRHTFVTDDPRAVRARPRGEAGTRRGGLPQPEDRERSGRPRPPLSGAPGADPAGKP